jgi:hypothetical protein
MSVRPFIYSANLSHPWVFLRQTSASFFLYYSSHCCLTENLDWHLEAGLAMVFAEAPTDQRAGPSSEIIKPTWLDLCPIYAALPADQQ